ncbi:hypothetical protein TU94_28510 [Streptomyces cyaneogriseus subsp. noncyanogenus]|uniref:Uncharacterized protein n=1 Tax=Streptomyces cyaneogriseus subsp. noncyanogenus TaxID=477245 RepID=A0A0C5FXI8_9ACTN|nr:hypothetical protein [Streptomyces cyaneogriseus]AJP04802.1 hypothetical protein TU94_28510 [Streptomyces cyaneogriseus subsp. noncyanogenus]
MSNPFDIDPRAMQEAHERRLAAMRQIKVGATYQHIHGDRDVVVTDLDEDTGYVWWRAASGPGPADSHRTLYCADFLTAYRLKPQR